MIKFPPVAISKLRNSQQAFCTGNLTLTASWQDVPGCSLSLGIGTWLIIGQTTTFNGAGTAGTASTKIYYGSTDLAISEITGGVAFVITITIQDVLTLTSPQTVKLAAQYQQTGWQIEKFSDGTILGTSLIALQLS